MKSTECSLAALDEVRKAAGPPGERLRALSLRHIRSITDETYSAVLLTDLESLTRAQRRCYVALRDRFEQGVRAIIEEGIGQGEFVRQDVSMAGFAILGAINWISKWYSAGGPRSAQEIADAFADFFLRGLRAGETAGKPAPGKPAPAA